MDRNYRLFVMARAARWLTVTAVALSAPGAPAALAQPQPTSGTPIVILDRRGEVTPLPGLPEGWHFYDPAVSPDGKRVAFIASRTQGNPQNDILVYTLPSGPIVRLATGANHRAPSWVPGGDEIGYSRLASPAANSSSFVVQKSDGSSPARTILTLPVQMTSSTWFPDGKRVVIAHLGIPARRESKMFVLSLDRPDSLVVIADGDMLNSRPAVSPDGAMIAYTASEPARLASGAQSRGRQTLHVHRFGDGAQVAIEAYSGTTPAWSANGADLFFQSATTPARLYKVRIRTGRTLDADAPVLESDYEFDDSGSGFALLSGGSSFVVRAARPKAVIAAVPANIRGKRATTGEQRQLELVAARAIVDIAVQQGRGFERFGIDMRAYVPRTDGVWAGFADSVKSHVLAAHIEGHVTAVGRILKTAGLIKDEDTCIMNGPAACRMGPFPGMVSFSPAIVSSDSARITVIRSERGMSATPDLAPTSSIYWRMVFVRAGAEWTLRSINGVPPSAASASPSAAPASATSATRTVTNPMHGWSIEYPTGWAIDPRNPSQVMIVPPPSVGRGAFGIHVAPVRFTTVDSLVDFVIAQQSAAAPGFKVLSRKSIFLSDSVPALELETELGVGTVGHSRRIIVLRSGIAYILDGEGYVTAWAALEPYYAKMIASFRIK